MTFYVKDLMKKFSRILAVNLLAGCLLSLVLASAVDDKKSQKIPFTTEYKEDGSVLIWHQEQLMVDNMPISLNKTLATKEDLLKAGYTLRKETNKEFVTRIRGSLLINTALSVGIIAIPYATKYADQYISNSSMNHTEKKRTQQLTATLSALSRIGLSTTTLYQLWCAGQNFFKGKRVIIVPINQKK
jgi:hypothetical protein